MLKKIFVLLFIASFIYAQDFTGIRIYINPGHGGHDSDDRYIPATGFWESEGNLSKGLYLKAILDSLGATTKISRTQNRTQDDLGLSVISEDANNFNADYFHSIHSNAYNGKSNYTLLLYKEVNGAPAFPQAKTMSDIMSDEIYKAHRTTTKYVRGDKSFLGFNLGVLRNLTMPGTLSEGSFHDYIPESWRLKSEGYLKHEAWAITKAFIRYFNLGTLPYGEIAGILRDPFEVVSYYYIPSTNDAKVPLNIVKATLMPGNKVYNGDSFNNGFFLLDKVTPGTYDVILEAENYKKDTVSVTVTAGKTVFADKYLVEKPNYNVPQVTLSLPQNTVDVRLDSKIVFNFDIKMNKASVQNAFSITPSVTGTFKWEFNDKKMTFTPANFLQGGTDYQITLTTGAKSYYDVNIANTFTHFFRTREALKLVKAYPPLNGENISTTVKIKAKFDAPIDQMSLGGNVLFKDDNGNDVGLYIDEVDYANGWIIFGPAKPLVTNAVYHASFLHGIKDTEGSNLKEDVIITFRTEHGIEKEGTIINDFEEIGNWWQPEQSGSTIGVDVNSSTFSISTKRFKSGSHSGRLTYLFSSDSGGVCRVYNQDEPAIESSNKKFGMWVFGDFSSNVLEYWFRDNSNQNIIIPIDTLNWTGWKFKEVDLNNKNASKFHSMVIRQVKGAESKGQLYFDKILTDVVTDINGKETAIPTKFKLQQNYPNPFNPTTTITYTIPAQITSSHFGKGRTEEGLVSLIVYDVLGREVATLVNKKQSPGNYQIVFDASNLSSGVYYYQLEYGSYLQTKKMILLR